MPPRFGKGGQGGAFSRPIFQNWIKFKKKRNSRGWGGPRMKNEFGKKNRGGGTPSRGGPPIPVVMFKLPRDLNGGVCFGRGPKFPGIAESFSEGGGGPGCEIQTPQNLPFGRFLGPTLGPIRQERRFFWIEGKKIRAVGKRGGGQGPAKLGLLGAVRIENREKKLRND